MKRTLTATLLSACLFALPASPVLAADSGFIDDAPELAADPDRPGAGRWIKPGFVPTGYSKVLLDPITVFVSPDSKYKGLGADHLNAIGEGFNKAMVEALAPELTVATEPGPGVLHVRAALTDVHLEKKKRGLLGYTPVGIVVTAAADAAGARISLKSAMLEIEVLDAATGERLGVLRDSAPQLEGEKDLDWKAVEKTFAWYATRFKATLRPAQ